MPRYEDLPYRPCVGLMVLNPAGRVFIGQRLDGPEHVDRTHDWQMPQGGVDPGEDPWPAALRELHEETNIRSVERLGEIDINCPGGHKPEFIAWRWEPMANLPALIIPFKRPVYERVVQEFAKFAGK